MNHEPMLTLRECLWWLSSHDIHIEMHSQMIPVRVNGSTEPIPLSSHRFRIRGPLGIEYNLEVYDILDFDDHFIKACNEICNKIETPPNSQTTPPRRARNSIPTPDPLHGGGGES